MDNAGWIQVSHIEIILFCLQKHHPNMFYEKRMICPELCAIELHANQVWSPTCFISRFFCVNDVFILKLSPHEKRGDAQILMKIVKIDGSNQKRSTYRINRLSTLFEVWNTHQPLAAVVRLVSIMAVCVFFSNSLYAFSKVFRIHVHKSYF